MADDDEKKKHTLDSLFALYANFPVLQVELDNEIYDAILLSQLDFWLDQAKLLETTFSRTLTGQTYMRYNKWRLNYEDFLEFLDSICEEVHTNVEEVKKLMVEAGAPGGNTGAAPVSVK